MYILERLNSPDSNLLDNLQGKNWEDGNKSSQPFKRLGLIAKNKL